jgi:hypothetical protein
MMLWRLMSVLMMLRVFQWQRWRTPSAQVMGPELLSGGRSRNEWRQEGILLSVVLSE